MTIEEFYDLDELEQHEELWDHGVQIGERLEGHFKVILYQIHSFYIELYYHIEYNCIRKLYAFDDTDELHYYL